MVAIRAVKRNRADRAGEGRPRLTVDRDHQKPGRQMCSQAEYLLLFAGQVPVGIRKDHQMIVAMSCSFDALCQLREIGIGNVGENQGNHVGPVAAQATRQTVGTIAELCDRLFHRGTQALRHRSIVAEHP